MSRRIEIVVPDLGDFEDVDVVEVLVAVGDKVEKDASLITLESEKASMEVPATVAGVVRSLAVEVGSKVSEGAPIAVLEVGGESSDDSERDRETESETAEASTASGPTPFPGPRRASAAAEPTMEADVLVLGSGPGGYTAAFRAADLGQHTVLVERYPSLGGVCLNVGCIPSKALLHAAGVIQEAAEFAGRGVVFGEPRIELDRLRDWKQSVVGRLTGGLRHLADKRSVDVVEGTGVFEDAHTLRVEKNGSVVQTVRFAHAIVAAGSSSVRIPGLPYDDPRLLDSTAALELREIPERLLILGGGIIGLEMATVYGALGSHITIVELLDRLMTGCDRDLVRSLERRLKKRIESIRLSTRLTAIEARDEGLLAHFEDQDGSASEESFSQVLLAVGRRPNGHAIGAEAAGLVVDDRGFLRVDDQQRTNVPHIFAIGDITGEPLLAHKATHEGRVAAEVIAGEKSGFDARVIPSVAYTDPEVAWVGLTEETARAEGISFDKGVFPWSASGRALGLGREDGMTKLLFDASSHQLLGAGFVGPHAGDLVAEAGLAIEMAADARDLALTIHPHPTLSETIAMAAEVFEGTVTDLYMPKKR